MKLRVLETVIKLEENKTFLRYENIWSGDQTGFKKIKKISSKKNGLQSSIK